MNRLRYADDGGDTLSRQLVHVVGVAQNVAPENVGLLLDGRRVGGLSLLHRPATKVENISSRLMGEFLSEVASEFADGAHDLSTYALGRQMNVIGGPPEGCSTQERRSVLLQRGARALLPENSYRSERGSVIGSTSVPNTCAQPSTRASSR